MSLCLLGTQAAFAMRSGSEYRSMPEEQRLVWTAGATEGILAAQALATGALPPLTACPAPLPPLANCVEPLPYPEIAQMLDEWLKERPEVWNRPVSLGLLTMLEEHCEKDD